MTGSSDNPTALAARFSPVSNEKRDQVVAEQELPVLIATDVLSEGQNLQAPRRSVGGERPGAVASRVAPVSVAARHTASLLPEQGLLIDHFPFRMGRAEEAREPQPQTLNDLWLLDKMPFVVSRNHLTILVADGSRFVVQDCGSQLGTTVNEKIGGASPLKEVELEEGDNVLILGVSSSSPFKFRAVLERIHV